MTEQQQQSQKILDMVAAGADTGALVRANFGEYFICRILAENGYVWDKRGIRKRSQAPTSTKAAVPDSFTETLRDLIFEHMGNDREDISPDAVMCILDDLDAKEITYPEGMDQLDVRELIAELDADRQMEARPRKANGKPVGKSAIQLAEFKPKRPVDEVWYPCKSPASSYYEKAKREAD